MGTDISVGTGKVVYVPENVVEYDNTTPLGQVAMIDTSIKD
jgi:hypothetical protein